MAEDLFKTILTDFIIGLFIGLLVVGVVAHANPSTLNEAAYGQALNLMQGKIGSHAEQLTSLAFSILSPLLGWQKESAKNVISFFLLFPLLRLMLASILAFGALRLWKFSRLEAGIATALLVLSAPIALAFYPGLMSPEAIAIPCALLGLFGLAWSAHEKGHAPAGLVLALIGFTLSIWVFPWMMALPLSIFVGQLALNHRNLPNMLNGKWEAIAFLVVLMVPLAALAAGPLPTFVASMEGLVKFFYLGRFALGLAAVSLAAVLAARKEHPQALFFGFVALAAVAFSTVSPAAAMVAMLLPMAYGFRALSQIGKVSLVTKALLLGTAIFIIAIGLQGASVDLSRTLGFGALALLGALSVVHLYNWSPGFVSSGLAVFLLAGGVLVGVQSVPGIGPLSPYYYQPLSNSTQSALLWMGTHHEAGTTPRVAVLAPAEAVQALAGGQLASDNQTLLRWLAGGPNVSSPLKAGDYILATPDLFDEMKSNEWQLGKTWSLVAFQFSGNYTDPQRGTYATYLSSQIGLLQPIDAEGKLTTDKPQAVSLLTGANIGALSASDVALLRPEQPIGADGNLLLWLNTEYNANILRLFRNDAMFKSIYVNGSTEVLQVVG